MSCPRPEVVTDEHLIFLDDLRESGETNMFGASPFVQEEFFLNRADASAVVSYWIDSLGERNP